MWPFNSKKKDDNGKVLYSERDQIRDQKISTLVKLFGRDVSKCCSHQHVTYLLIEKVLELQNKVDSLEKRINRVENNLNDDKL